ncbi:aminotransferase class I/II-fold pyridoxal phosphate-dependent enzyme [Cryobacterium algoricola]|uniref:Aminotransferase class I/II-fold pyridoxal phosphate-dependent enzyme n=1 Tax=Cryobacterium algoricola TaxID=1259183 RepID=A0ABY2I757_9MICO|nr:aminotransferase class I/II-fold pyridoxal phosphate-dependent enzyme [Cryobacterium algoricola]TFB82588.1 aminotransferase class I/II-fold pyridoxal phosphate-dependent enzyme [Cryobacterium algoricola]
MTSRIYLSSPDVGALEEEYLLRAFRSGWIAPLGPDVDGFEADMAARIGVGHAVALSSGTAALHVALAAWGVGPGGVVLTSTMTFAATANAIAYTGAEPFFIDCDLDTGNMSVTLLEQALRELSARGERIAAIVPVDLLGKVADYSRIQALADQYGVRVLADAAESLGASHEGKPAGAFGAASVFSFNGNKVMTTSGGGMVTTNDDQLASRIRYLSTQARQPVLHYEHREIGYNYRLSNLLAALGRAQLERLDGMILRRREIRSRYREFFQNVPGVEIFGGSDDSADNCWLTSIVVDSAESGWTPGELSASLAADQIESRPLWKPMHLQPVFQGARSRLNGASEQLFTSGLTLPSGSVLNEDELLRVSSGISRFLDTVR